MDWNWEDFDNKPVLPGDKTIKASINARGYIYLNRGAVAALGEPAAVALRYDRRRSVIGVTATELSDPKAFKLIRKDRDRTRSRIVSANNFCRHFGIRPEETLAFTQAAVEKGVLVLDLNEVESARKI